MRGEYSARSSLCTKSSELPPRARRIQRRNFGRYKCVGTTSACAENTAPRKMRVDTRRNYLRVRGEYKTLDSQIGIPRELPPRARRIHRKNPPQTRQKGTTSACAENTGSDSLDDFPLGNYLRVRGEYPSPFPPNTCGVELPPRARRIHINMVHIIAHGGTTSACAENTFPACPRICPGRNYLRVRGEYPAG